MNGSELTLDFLNKEMTKARRAGKILTDIVLGKKEMEIIRSWAYESFPSKKEDITNIPNFKVDTEMWGVSLHEINKDSYWEIFNLALDNYHFIAPGDDFETLNDQVIQDEKRMEKLIKENKISSE